MRRRGGGGFEGAGRSQHELPTLFFILDNLALYFAKLNLHPTLKILVTGLRKTLWPLKNHFTAVQCEDIPPYARHERWRRASFLSLYCGVLIIIFFILVIVRDV